MELLKCTQGAQEDALSYGSRLAKLLNELIKVGQDGNDTPVEKAAAVNIFKRQAHTLFQEGLRDDLKILVKSRRSADLQEAISIAIEEERCTNKRTATFALNRGTNSASSGAQRYCYNCKKSGHLTKDCWKNNSSDGDGLREGYPETEMGKK